MKEQPYVLVSVNGILKYWPYPEVQEFTMYDLSDLIIYLTDEELEHESKKLEES